MSEVINNENVVENVVEKKGDSRKKFEGEEHAEKLALVVEYLNERLADDPSSPKASTDRICKILGRGKSVSTIMFNEALQKIGKFVTLVDDVKAGGSKPQYAIFHEKGIMVGKTLIESVCCDIPEEEANHVGEKYEVSKKGRDIILTPVEDEAA